MIDIVQAVADYFVHAIYVPTVIMYQAGWFYSSTGLTKYLELLGDVALSKTKKD